MQCMGLHGKSVRLECKPTPTVTNRVCNEPTQWESVDTASAVRHAAVGRPEQRVNSFVIPPVALVQLSGKGAMPSGPSRIDTRPWHQGPDSPQYPGYVIEPGRIYQWDAPVTNNCKFVQHSWELQHCVGGGS